MPTLETSHDKLLRLVKTAAPKMHARTHSLADVSYEEIGCVIVDPLFTGRDNTTLKTGNQLNDGIAKTDELLNDLLKVQQADQISTGKYWQVKRYVNTVFSNNGIAHS